MTGAGGKAARRREQRYRGFPLTWEVIPHQGWFSKCQRPLPRKKDRHARVRWMIATPGAYGSGNIVVCEVCCTHQQGLAIRWAKAHGNRAEMFR